MEANQALLVKLFDDVLKKAKQYQQFLIVGFVGASVLGGAVFGYGYYKSKVRAAAYKDFMSAMQYYDGVVKNQKMSRNPNIKFFENETDKWQQTEQTFKIGYMNYKNTEMAPVFLAFQAEAQLNLGKVDEAVSSLKTVIDLLKSDEVRDCYKVKIALIKMDKDDAKVKDEGFAELLVIANNDSSAANEIALYQAGSFFWNQKNYNEAKNYWQRLLVKTTAKSGQPSVFAGEVREKLGLITAGSL